MNRWKQQWLLLPVPVLMQPADITLARADEPSTVAVIGTGDMGDSLSPRPCE
jgi:hypothetical protein